MLIQLHDVSHGLVNGTRRAANGNFVLGSSRFSA